MSTGKLDALSPSPGCPLYDCYCSDCMSCLSSLAIGVSGGVLVALRWKLLQATLAHASERLQKRGAT